MSSIRHVPSRVKEIDRALRGLGFRLAGYRSDTHPYYEHPQVEGQLTIPGTPRSAGVALKRALSKARRMLADAGIQCP